MPHPTLKSCILMVCLAIAPAMALSADKMGMVIQPKIHLAAGEGLPMGTVGGGSRYFQETLKGEDHCPLTGDRLS